MDQSNTGAIQKEWEHKLRLNGSRLTEPRRAILKVVAESDHPLSPIDVFDQARASEPKLGLVTVYRTLEKLESLDLIDRVHHLGQCQTVFRGTHGHQHLLICTQCGASIYFDGLEAESQFKRIAEENGFSISGHWLQLYGLCAGCKAKKENNSAA